MKKILCLLALLCFAMPAQAGLRSTVERRVVKDATTTEVAQTIMDVAQVYNGVETITEADTTKNIFVADYNDKTFLGLIGVDAKWSSATKVKATYSASLKPINDNKDVLITCRKHSYNLTPTYNHYKKIFNELKLNGKKVVKY